MRDERARGMLGLMEVASVRVVKSEEEDTDDGHVGVRVGMEG